MADYGIPLSKLFFAGLLSLILTIDAIMGLQALYYWQLDRAETSADLYPPSSKLEKRLADQRTRLTDYRIEDAKKGIVAIPIGRAMQLVVHELSRNGAATTVPEGESR